MAAALAWFAMRRDADGKGNKEKERERETFCFGRLHSSTTEGSRNCPTRNHNQNLDGESATFRKQYVRAIQGIGLQQTETSLRKLGEGEENRKRVKRLPPPVHNTLEASLQARLVVRKGSSSRRCKRKPRGRYSCVPYISARGASRVAARGARARHPTVEPGKSATFGRERERSAPAGSACVAVASRQSRQVGQEQWPQPIKLYGPPPHGKRNNKFKQIAATAWPKYWR